MVEKKKSESVRMQELEAENLRLKAEAASRSSQPALNSFMDEMQAIKAKTRVESNTIKVQDFSDHTNISLWTKWGKRVGPLHPYTAEKVFRKFWDMGVQLSATRPTEEDMNAFWESDEGKKRKKWQDERRVVRMKSKRSGEVEKILQTISDQTGQSVKALNSILPAEAVGVRA